MCGFAAFVVKEGGFDRQLLITESLKALDSRGPDNREIYQVDNLVMVFTRLSIIDLTPEANQPISSLCGRYVMVYNGEVYNFRDLLHYLPRKTRELVGRSDTRTVLELYAMYGSIILKKLRGMWAFVVFDRSTGVLSSYRDEFGIKPLFYSENKFYFGYSSSTKCLRIGRDCTISRDESLNFLFTRSFTRRGTGFDDIQSQEPGSAVSYQINNHELHFSRWRDSSPFSRSTTQLHVSSIDRMRMLEDSISCSLERNFNSEYPVSMQLSGGLDSSLLVGLTRKFFKGDLVTYGIRIPGFSGSEDSEQVAVSKLFDTRHVFVDFGPKQFTDALDSTVSSLDRPTSHIGCVALSCLYSMASLDHRVMITGEGADEIFLGYSRYVSLRNHFPFIHKLVKTSVGNKVVESSGIPSLISSSLNFDLLARIWPNYSKSFSWGSKRYRFQDLLAYDRDVYLGTLLHRQDALSMAHGIEARVPYLDADIVSSSALFDTSRHLIDWSHGIRTKSILKRIGTTILPSTVVYKRKNGLSLPYSTWLQENEIIRERVAALIDTNGKLRSYAESGLKFDEFVMGALDRRKTEEPGLARIIFVFLSVDAWLRSC